MNGPTRSAPQAWRNVLRKMVPIWPRGRRNRAIRNQDTMMAVPAMNGSNFQDDVTVPPSDPTEVTFGSYGMYFVSEDQGPVQATTTAIRMRNGTSERITRRRGLPDQCAAGVPGLSAGVAPAGTGSWP